MSQSFSPRALIHSICLLFVTTLIVGCGGDGMPDVPEAPDKTVEAVAASLSEGEPIMVWAAMPESYRADVTDLVHSFGAAVDQEVYDKTFVVVGKLGDVLASKKEFFLNHPMAQQNLQVDKAQLRANWDAAFDPLQILADSQIATAEGLQTIDIADFLNDEGADVMQQLSKLSAAAAANPMAKLGTVTAKVTGQSEGTATLEVTDPDGKTDTLEMVQVEGRWVPKEIADGWDQQIADAKKQIAEMAEQGTPNKAWVMGLLTMAETTLDELAAAETQEQFNQTIGQVMQGMQGFPGTTRRPEPTMDTGDFTPEGL